MDWVKLRTSYYRDPKVLALPDADAEMLFVRGLGYVGEQETRGYIPEHALSVIARKRRYDTSVSALLATGLWTRVNGGYQITRWDDNQEGLEGLAKRRAADRERKRRQRAAERSESSLLTPQSRDQSTGRHVTVTPPEKRRQEKTVPPTAGDADASPRASPPQPVEEATAQMLVGEYVDHCKQRPPNQFIGKLAKTTKSLLDEGFAANDIRRGMTVLIERGLDASVLPSTVNQVINQQPQMKPSTTDQRVNTAVQLAARYAEEGQ